MADLSENFKDMRDKIFNHMLETRESKYKWFLRALRSFKYLSLSPTRGNLLESYYILMRYIDDIVDGDVPLPERYDSKEKFVEGKIEFSKNPSNPSDASDLLMVYCFDIADKLNFSINEETEDILTSMLFDAKRHGKKIIFSENELKDHFYLLDVKGTIKCAIKVFKEDYKKYEAIEPLGIASRIFYNLRDYEEDYNAGLINISLEDVQRFGIKEQDLENKVSGPVKAWFKDQARQGLEQIEEYLRRTFREKFSPLVKLTLPLVYEKPARRYFENILQNV